MGEKLRLVKGGTPKAVLVYGVRMFEENSVAEVRDAGVRLKDGNEQRVTMHVIEGTPAQIRRQLEQSLEAFFDLLEDTPR